MRITSDGYVGINNTSPAGLFEIGDAQVAGSNMKTVSRLKQTVKFGTAPTKLLQCI